MSVVADARVLVLDERSRFDTFVVGSTTHDAAEAAWVVAESPGARWNPLVIRGGPGLGKTHLLGAIARRARDVRPALRIVALSATTEVQDGADVADLLLIDDVRPGLDAAYAVALRTLVDGALAAGRQVVVAEEGSAPMSRDEASAWMAQSARTRLVHVGVPDDAARRLIVHRAADARSLPLGADALDDLAREPVTSVRELLSRLSRAGANHGGAPATAAGGADDDFASFLDEVAREVASQVEPWRMRLGEAAARWRAAELDVAVLERALRLPQEPDVDALLATFEAAAARLRRAERRVVAADPSLAGHPAFRDPTRVAEAEAMARRAMPRPALPAPNATLDPENWVFDWPDVGDLLVETWP